MKSLIPRGGFHALLLRGLRLYAVFSLTGSMSLITEHIERTLHDDRERCKGVLLCGLRAWAIFDMGSRKKRLLPSRLNCFVLCLSANASKGFGTIRQLSSQCEGS